MATKTMQTGLILPWKWKQNKDTNVSYYCLTYISSQLCKSWEPGFDLIYIYTDVNQEKIHQNN